MLCTDCRVSGDLGLPGSAVTDLFELRARGISTTYTYGALDPSARKINVAKFRCGNFDILRILRHSCGVPSPIPTRHTCDAPCSVQCALLSAYSAKHPCVLDVDWCLRSDAITKRTSSGRSRSTCCWSPTSRYSWLGLHFIYTNYPYVSSVFALVSLCSACWLVPAIRCCA